MSRKIFSSALLVTLVSTPLAFLLATQTALFGTTGLLVGKLIIIFIASAGSAWIAVRASIPAATSRRPGKPVARASSARSNSARNTAVAGKEKSAHASETAAPPQGPREAGQVKWFNASKGFGFITRDSGEDIFVHFRSIRGDGHRVLKDGQRVEFSVSMGDKGMQADDVAAQSR